jgi:hypothetical protein
VARQQNPNAHRNNNLFSPWRNEAETKFVCFRFHEISFTTVTMEELRTKVTRTRKMQLVKKLKEYDIVWETNPHVISDTLEFVLEQINLSQRLSCVPTTTTNC